MKKLISQPTHQEASELIIEKYKRTVHHNRELEKLIANPKIVSKVGFEYPVNWMSEQMKNKIMEGHNTI